MKKDDALKIIAKKISSSEFGLHELIDEAGDDKKKLTLIYDSLLKHFEPTDEYAYQIKNFASWGSEQSKEVETVELFWLALSLDRVDECLNKCKQDKMYIPNYIEIADSANWDQFSEKTVQDLISCAEVAPIDIYTNCRLLEDVFLDEKHTPNAQNLFNLTIESTKENIKVQNGKASLGSPLNADDVVMLITLLDRATYNEQTIERFNKIGCSVDALKNCIMQLDHTQQEILDWFDSNYDNFQGIENFGQYTQKLISTFPTTSQRIE